MKEITHKKEKENEAEKQRDDLNSLQVNEKPNTSIGGLYIESEIHKPLKT